MRRDGLRYNHSVLPCFLSGTSVAVLSNHGLDPARVDLGRQWAG